jgi:hypothetical protein
MNSHRRTRFLEKSLLVLLRLLRTNLITLVHTIRARGEGPQGVVAPSLLIRSALNGIFGHQRLQEALRNAGLLSVLVMTLESSRPMDLRVAPMTVSG